MLQKFSIAKCHTILKKDLIATIGYGPQGRSQSLNLRDNGFKSILGLRKNGDSWKKAINDGWHPNYNLFSISDAVKRGSIIQYLISDAAQIKQWNTIRKNLRPNNTLYFSHGFGIVYADQTKIKPPKDVDVVLVAPKGPGSMLRNAKSVNSSYAVHQNYTSNATLKTKALAFAIGSNNIFPTTFEKEVYSDLTGERCVLMGLIQGAFKAQYDVLRDNGHSSEESFNETVEEALMSLYPLIHENGMDWMFRNCSSTAQLGALKWAPKFEKVLKPVIQECYEAVKSGEETKHVIKHNSDVKYRQNLEAQLAILENSEMWTTGRAIRKLR